MAFTDMQELYFREARLISVLFDLTVTLVQLLPGSLRVEVDRRWVASVRRVAGCHVPIASSRLLGRLVVEPWCKYVSTSK